MMLYSFSSALFATLSAAVVAAQQNQIQIPEDKLNLKGGNVFANYQSLRENKQAFLKGVAISGELCYLCAFHVFSICDK